MYCGVDESWCRASAYQKEAGVKVEMVRMSAGQTYAWIGAEEDNPHGDIWWGGIGMARARAVEQAAEALAITDRIMAMNIARTAQDRTPRCLHEQRFSHFVADVIGDANRSWLGG